jgi:hypothetical protein
MLAHNVYFTLKERSETSVQHLLAACKKYLPAHDGILFFACGTREPELTRAVNDLEFDVSLHIVFETKAAHDAYQLAPLHDNFVSECRDNWAKVRVFDSAVHGAK